MKKTYNIGVQSFKFFIYSTIIAFLFACASNNVGNTDGSGEHLDDLTLLHKAMNAKHGRTDSYYANLAVADGDYDRAYVLHQKECVQGSVIECLNAYYVGEERALSNYDSMNFAQQLVNSVEISYKACKRNESLGCVNLFFAFEALDDNNEFIKSIIAPSLEHYNDEIIADKALKLTKKECESDDATSCFFHARMLRIIDHYADVEYFVNKSLDLGYILAPFVRLPMQSPQTISYFKRSCALNEALSCRYVAYWLEKYENNKALAKEFYQKSCKLGLQSACDEMRKVKSGDKVDEVGSPIINRR